MANGTEENEMYGLAEYEISRQHRAGIRQEVAAYRLVKMARARRGTEQGLLRNLRWELARYVELFNKRLRNTA